jgi:hypothetical protein
MSDFDDEEGAGCSFWANNREPKWIMPTPL